MHQNECTVRTHNTTVYMFSEDLCSNFSSRIELIDMCTGMDKTICSSIKNSSKQRLIILYLHVILSFRHVKPYIYPLHQ